MTSSKSNHSDPVSTSWLKRGVRFVFRAAVRIIGTLMILLALLVLFAQTPYFQRLVRDQGVALLNQQLNGRVIVDDVRIDLFHGIVIEHPQLIAHGSRVLNAERLTLNYDLSALFVRVAAITNLLLEQPEIQIIRSDDSVWNVQRIGKASADTTSSEPPNGTFTVKRLRIDRGSLYVDDRTTEWPSGDSFDPTHLKIKDVKLDMGARLNLRAHDASFVINGLSFRDATLGPFTLNRLSTIVHLSPAGLDVTLLRIDMPRTQLQAAFTIPKVDIFTGFSDSLLLLHPLEGSVQAQQVWGPDLKYFIPDVDFLDAYNVKADVRFDGNTIAVNNVMMRAGPSDVRGRVTVSELQGQKPLHLNIAIFNSTGVYADIRRRMRFVPLPDLPFLTTTRLDTVYLSGMPDDSLYLYVQASDKPGAIAGEIELLMRDPDLGYRANLNISNGDLSTFSDSTIHSSLNGVIHVQGRGLTLATLQAEAEVKLSQSMLAQRDFQNVYMRLQADGHGTIVADSISVRLGSAPSDSAQQARLSQVQRLEMSGEISLVDPDRPVYSALITTDGLNVASLLRMPGMPQQLTMSINLYAEGFDIDSLRGTLGGRVQELTLDDRAMLPFTINASVSRNQSQRNFRLTTEFASIRVAGQYIPSQLISSCASGAEAMVSRVQGMIQHIVPGASASAKTFAAIEDFDVSISARITDASFVTMLLPQLHVSGGGDLRARMSVDNDQFVLTVDSLNTQQLILSGPNLEALIDPTHLKMDVKISSINAQPLVDRLTVNGFVDRLIIVNNVKLTSASVKLHHDGTQVLFECESGVNNTHFMAAGLYKPQTEATSISLDSARFVLDKDRDLRWQLLEPAIVNVSAGVYNIEKCVFQRPWHETISVSGIVSESSFIGGRVVIQNFPLTDITRFVDLDYSHPVRLVGGLVSEAAIQIDGTWEEPKIKLSLGIQNVSYNKAYIGELTGELNHQNQNVSGWARVTNTDFATEREALNLVVRSLPVNMAFTNVEQRVNEDRAWDLSLEAHALSLAVAEPFLPAIERVRGKTDAKIALQGSRLKDIHLSGAAHFWDGRFLASSTNVWYNSAGWVRLDGQNLYIDSIQVRNLEKDFKNGTAKASGVVVFKDLTVDSIDFTVRTPAKRGIMVMTPSSQARSPNVYGDLIIGSGLQPIRMFGKLDSPKLTGDIVVHYSNLTFPKERSTTKARSSGFEYIRSTDVAAKQSLEEYTLYGLLTDTSAQPTPADPMQQTSEAIKQAIKATSQSFVDIMDFDLEIFLRGRTLLTMNLGTFETLTADLEPAVANEPLTFTGRFADNNTDLRGSVRLKEGASTYKFYKPFRTSGLLNFSQGGMTNPGLDLVAVYQDRRNISSERSEEYKVELRITGTKERPRIAYRVWRNDREMVGDSTKIASDALMLILVGKTSDELTSSGQGDLVGQVNAAFSAVATNALSDIISDLGFVQNAQIDVGSDVSQSRIIVSGQLFGDVSYRVSGQISDLSGNSTFTVSIPLRMLSDAEAMKLFQADVSHTVNNSGNITRQTRLWEIKLGARIQ